MPVLELSDKIPQHEEKKNTKIDKKKSSEIKKSECFFLPQRNKTQEDECKVLSHVGDEDKQ